MVFLPLFQFDPFRFRSSILFEASESGRHYPPRDLVAGAAQKGARVFTAISVRMMHNMLLCNVNIDNCLILLLFTC